MKFERRAGISLYGALFAAAATCISICTEISALQPAFQTCALDGPPALVEDERERCPAAPCPRTEAPALPREAPDGDAPYDGSCRLCPGTKLTTPEKIVDGDVRPAGGHTSQAVCDVSPLPGPLRVSLSDGPLYLKNRVLRI